MESPSYGTTLSAFEREVIPEVASFEDEGLVSGDPRMMRLRKGNLKISWTMGELNSSHLSEMHEC